MKHGSPSRTTATHKTQTKIPGLVLSRLPMSSLLLLFLPKLLRGTRDRWVAQVSFIIIHSTGLAPFPRLSAPPHSSQICILKSLYFSVLALWIIELIEKNIYKLQVEWKEQRNGWSYVIIEYRTPLSQSDLRTRKKLLCIYTHIHSTYIHTYIHIHTHRGYWDMNQCSVFSR